MGDRRLSLPEALAKADEGSHRATDRAERVCPGWSALAVSALHSALPRMPAEFTFEELREQAQAFAPDPPDLRAWGQIVRHAIKNKLIAATGRFAPRRCGNGTPTMVYTRTPRS